MAASEHVSRPRSFTVVCHRPSNRCDACDGHGGFYRPVSDGATADWGWVECADCGGTGFTRPATPRNSPLAVATFRTELTAARVRLGLSQSQLARVIGVDHSHVSRLESGQRLPSFQVAHAITVALDLAPDDAAALMRAAGYHDMRGLTLSEPVLIALASILDDDDIDNDLKAELRGDLWLLVRATREAVAMPHERAWSAHEAQ